MKRGGAALRAFPSRTDDLAPRPLSLSHGPTFYPPHTPSQVRPTDIDEFNVVRNTVFHEYILGSAFF